MSINNTTYDIGDAPVLTINCSDIDGIPADPSALTVTVKPDGASAVVYTYPTADFTRTTLGVFRLQLPAFTTSGTRHVKALAAGLNAASEQGALIVRASNVV